MSKESSRSVLHTPRILSKTNALLAELCGLLLFLITAFIIIDFVGRNIGHPIYGVSIAAMFTMLAVVYLGLAYTEEAQEHIRVEALLDILPARYSRCVEIFVAFICIGTVGVMLWGVFMDAQSALQSSEAVPGPLPIITYPIKFLIFTGLVLYEIQIIVNTLNKIRGK